MSLLEKLCFVSSMNSVVFIFTGVFYLIIYVSAMMHFKNDFDLTGSEDPSVLTSYIMALNPSEGYREGTYLKTKLVLASEVIFLSKSIYF